MTEQKRTTKIHDIIYLQVEGDTFGDDSAVSWCEDRINDSDIEYRRVTPDDCNQVIQARLGKEIVVRLMEDDNSPEDAMIDAAKWITDTMNTLGYNTNGIKNYGSISKGQK